MNKIVASPQQRSNYRKTLVRVYDAEDLAPSGKEIRLLMVIRDVRTRWNWTKEMIQRALLQKDVRNLSLACILLQITLGTESPRCTSQVPERVCTFFNRLGNT